MKCILNYSMETLKMKVIIITASSSSSFSFSQPLKVNLLEHFGSHREYPLPLGMIGLPFCVYFVVDR